MSVWIVIAIGLLLMLGEIFTGTFFILFVGIAFILTGILELLFNFQSIVNTNTELIALQCILIGVLSFTLILFLRKYFTQKVFKFSEVYSDDFLNESGIGIVRGDMIEYKGTLWSYKKNNKKYKDGEQIIIKGVKNNQLIIQD